MLFTDLRELNTALQIDPGDTAEDKSLNFIIEWATRWIEEILNRDISYKLRTEYYDGTGTVNLLLRKRPLWPDPLPLVYLDESGAFGAMSGAFSTSTTQQVYGTDFTVRWDQDDGSSRSAILIRMRDFWPKKMVRQQGYLSPFVAPNTGIIKVTYAAGYCNDNLPAMLHLATVTLCSKLRHYLPLALEVSAENYEERAIAMIAERKDFIMAGIKPMIFTLKNWNW